MRKSSTTDQGAGWQKHLVKMPVASKSPLAASMRVENAIISHYHQEDIKRTDAPMARRKSHKPIVAGINRAIISIFLELRSLETKAIIFSGACRCLTPLVPGAIGWAQVIEHASRTRRIAGVANCAAVDDEPMGETRPFSRRQQLVEVPLDFFGILLTG